MEANKRKDFSENEITGQDPGTMTSTSSPSESLSGSFIRLREVVLCHKWTGGTKKRFSKQQKGRLYVQLVRKCAVTPLGITLSGTRDGRSKISYIKPDTAAHRCDFLEVGDVILSINSQTGMKHEELVNLIRDYPVDTPLRMELEYDFPSCPISCSEVAKTVEVNLTRDHSDSGFGFVVRNGIVSTAGTKGSLSASNKRLLVTSVRQYGPADKEGTIKSGDRVIAISGISIKDVDEAYKLMNGLNSVRFLVEYDVEPVVQPPGGGALLVEIEKTCGTALGLSVGQRWLNGRLAVVIETIRPASIADRCGALRPGDILLSIDDQYLDGSASLSQARHFLRIATAADNVRLEVTRSVNNIPPFRGSPDYASSLYSSTICALPQNSNQLCLPSYSNPYKSFQCSMHAGSSKVTKSMFDLTPARIGLHCQSLQTKSLTILGSCDPLGSTHSSSTQTIIAGHVCHAESVGVILQMDETGNFGFTLQSTCPITGNLVAPPFIGYVEYGGPAYRSSVMQAGDRILSVNGQRLEGCTLDGARALIKESGFQVGLEVEFDVTESVLLSSGTFQVKLIRKCDDLGIAIMYSKYSQSEDPPLISEVKKGSIAYRSGMIQPGDRLLAIDQHSLAGKSIAEITALLRNFAFEEIVKLKLRKDEFYAEDNSSNHGVTYTVEIQRQGGPLGITISTPEVPFDPVFVSGLCEGGLVDRTNAIHVGDKILAINGVSLRGKGLNDALKLLQCGHDPVTLKIFRPSSLSLHRTYPSSMLGNDNANSLDSALESWTSSHISDQHFSDQSPDIDQTNSSTTILNSVDMQTSNEASFPACSEESKEDNDSDGLYDNCANA